MDQWICPSLQFRGPGSNPEHTLSTYLLSIDRYLWLLLGNFWVKIGLFLDLA